ncbi:carbohydrate ABC transporter permease, partial [bacterium]|nr:carbohydrate ABC transporter permease [bacterium]
MKFRRILFRFLFLILIILFLGYLLFPIYWAINTSLTPSKNLSKTPADYLPFPPDFNAFQRILSNSIFKISLLNSAIVAGSATLLALFLGALAACALGRFRFPGKRPILYIILAMTMFPQISIVGSLYEMIVNVGLYNTKFALAASYLLTTLPFTIWILTSFFKSLPSELEEAAYVDGATPLQTFRFVLLPLAAPGIVTSGILAFIHSWNEYLFAMTFTPPPPPPPP